jgi:hypothetical protein
MTKDHRRVDAELARGASLDEPAFLREIVERLVQELLEAEMTEHVGTAPENESFYQKLVLSRRVRCYLQFANTHVNCSSCARKSLRRVCDRPFICG